ncbi:MAG: 1-acyl-sn-glycerol-3-phosphate acyltransferase [bacterium]|nr:1-acyl-sn-glycerol-3-phosphate acyltransferase [bacterium]
MPNLRPDDLFDPASLTSELRELLVPRLAAVVQAATSGDRARLHAAERSWAAAVVAELEIDLRVHGEHLIDSSQQYVVVPLHEGFADVLALLSLPLDLSWVIRDELLELPYFGDYLRLAGYIAVEPESPRAAMRTIIRKAAATADDGESLVIFPQGSVLGLDVSFHPGAFHVARRLDLPILPVVLTGSHRIWEYPFTRTLRWGQTIHLEMLSPISPADALDSMPRLEREMKTIALAVEAAPPRRYLPERDGTWPSYRFAVKPV